MDSQNIAGMLNQLKAKDVGRRKHKTYHPIISDEGSSKTNPGSRRSSRLKEKQGEPQLSKPTAEIAPPSSKRKRFTAEEVEVASSSAAQPSHSRPSTPKRHKRPIPTDWTPPLAIGASLGPNLSRLEKAERLVLQWEAILENARQTQPGVDLSSLQTQLEKVTRERDEMEDTEENLIPTNELDSTKTERINERLEDLDRALERCNCTAAEVNIRAAMDGYKNGRIQCWNKWTLIYGGHIVDFCPSYASFTEDREERLDSYSRRLGPGWLWFEPPLAAPQDSTSHLLAATWAQPSDTEFSQNWGSTNCWKITMGFRRVQTFHSRSEGGTTVQVPLKAQNVMSQNPTAINPQTRPRGRNNSFGKTLVYKPKHTGLPKKQVKSLHWAAKDDAEGPRCCFLMLLDSGASMSTLYEDDLVPLGIDPRNYPSQTEMRIQTANGTVRAPVYELRVDVCKHNGESLVGDNETAVWPAERHELGGICTVAVFPGTVPKAGTDDNGPLERQDEQASEELLARREFGEKHQPRLSGLLPFQVCYLAGAPGSRLWFGEDRCDVLGADRMPGQRRNELHKRIRYGEIPVALDSLRRLSSIRFEHDGEGKGERITDEDVRGDTGRSRISVFDEAGERVKTYRIEPRRMPSQMHAASRD